MTALEVDVILCSNRQSPFLFETLESLRRQSFSNWRLILVDDGSPCPEFFDRLVSNLPGTRVVHQPARGLPAARNTAITVGSAPLIAFLDDDDIWHSEKLQSQVLAHIGDPAAVASFTAGHYIDSAGFSFNGGWLGDTAPSREFIRGAAPLPRIVTLMVTRVAMARVGPFNESYSVGEDNEFVIRLALSGNLTGVPRDLVSYRRHDGNMSKDFDVAGRQSSWRLLKEQLHVAKSRGDSASWELLEENLRTSRCIWAPYALRNLKRALVGCDFRSAWGELGGVYRCGPKAILSAILDRWTT